MTMTVAPDLWSNPLQRFGFIDLNVIVGYGIEQGDGELFFGPLRDTDAFREVTTATTLPGLLVGAGFFSSIKEANRRGYVGPIPDGFTDFIVKQWGKKHRICILKIAAKIETEEPH